MQKNMLEIKNLYVSVNEKHILNGVNLKIKAGEIHVLMGQNGTGKSTLANVIMGDPRYNVDKGQIIFENENITNEKTNIRARKGIFLSFQAPEEIDGITLENFLRAAKSACGGKDLSPIAFRKELYQQMKELNMDESYASRYLNVGFSGGEKKKSEILQLAVLNPKLAILDETDSGLDVDAVKTISESINKFRNKDNAILIITHITKILDNLPVDYVHIMSDGKIIRTADKSIIETIGKKGFSAVLQDKD